MNDNEEPIEEAAKVGMAMDVSLLLERRPVNRARVDSHKEQMMGEVLREPSDTTVEAVAEALYLSAWAHGEYGKTSEFNKDSWRLHARAALRAAGGARDV